MSVFPLACAADYHKTPVQASCRLGEKSDLMSWHGHCGQFAAKFFPE